MDTSEMVRDLTADLQWQVDQMRARAIKDDAGHPYSPAHYVRGLEKAIELGDEEVVGFVKCFLTKPPTAGYKRLAAADSVDLACEVLVADDTKSYAPLFTDPERTAARERLAPHREAISARNAAWRARIDAQRARIRAEGMPSRLDLDGGLMSRRRPR
jgi:hypothetical protein